jgi:hypothetical protein
MQLSFLGKDTAMWQRIAVMVSLALINVLSGCASVEGTRDKSTTLVRHAVVPSTAILALAPIIEVPGVPGVATQVEQALGQALPAQLTPTTLLGATSVRQRLVTTGQVDAFAQWRATYTATGVLLRDALAPLAQALQAQYLLLIPRVTVTRDHPHIRDIGRTGTGTRYVWRTVCTIEAEVIAMETGTVLWKGMGQAENIVAPRNRSLIVVEFQERTPPVDELLPELVAVATQGLAQQVAAGVPGRRW